MGNQLNPLPVTIVLGFSGSGKTTLVEYLTHQQGITVQVIQSRIRSKFNIAIAPCNCLLLSSISQQV